jgi:putative ABC transport system permease protein
MQALALTMAWRELRHGVAGFQIFLACLILGVAAVAAVNSVSEAFLSGLSVKGRELLGGDLEFRLTQREASAAELAWMKRQGQVSMTSEMRGMIKLTAAGERTLVELKSVDSAYPLYGAVETKDPAANWKSLLEPQDGHMGVLVEENLLAKLNAKIGDIASIGEAQFALRGVLKTEPDRVAGGFALGPRVLISGEGLRATKLIQPGSLISFNYRIALPGTERNPAALKSVIDNANKAFPQAGWQPRDRWNAAPGVRRFIAQVTAFLTLVGLTALVVGGVGVGNAVRGYVDRRRADIATLKCLGATGGFIVTMFLCEVLALALLGTFIGLALGAAGPFLLEYAMGEAMPIPSDFSIYPYALAQAGAFGMTVALLFGLWPLARAREVSPAGLFRDVVSPERRWPRIPYLIAIGCIAAAMLALALWTASNTWLALGFAAAAIASFLVLRGSAFLLMRLAKAARVRSPVWRLALSNLHRPGAATPAVMLSLGLGLTLIATIALIDRNLRRSISEDLPGQAPSFFFVDVQSDQTVAFDAMIESFKSASDYRRSPMLRGRITRIKGVPAADAKVDPDVRWALNGDRGISYGDPPGAKAQLIEGAWWSNDGEGVPRVSFDHNWARGMGLKIGDKVTINVAGRDIDLTIANVRRIDYSNARMNFSLIVSPGVVEAAPHMHLATVRTSIAEEEAVDRAVAEKFPNVSVIRVREAIGAANDLLSQLADAIRAASLITLVTGVLVLAGAIAAGQRQRLYDAVILKVLGASRAKVLKVFVLEFALIGLAAALIACLASGLAAWAVVTQVMEAKFQMDLTVLVLVVFSGVALTLVLGMAGTWEALGAKPAHHLRAA